MIVGSRFPDEGIRRQRTMRYSKAKMRFQSFFMLIPIRGISHLLTVDVLVQTITGI